MLQRFLVRLNRRSLLSTSSIYLKTSFEMSTSTNPIPISNYAKSIPENIWVRTVGLVQKYNPVNLGQGFPDFPEVVPDRIKAALIKTQSPGASVNNNQYCRGQGQIDLVKQISELYGPLYGRDIDPLKEILVTVGGYESLHCIINAVVDPGDEVILIEPFFDSYKESIRACGGKARGVPLKLKPGGRTSQDFVLDQEELTKTFTDKTKAIIVNTPHNPTGKVFTRKEIEFIANLCKTHNALYISDEVYEWLVYEGAEHVRAATLPGMWDRTVTVCSAGKTFNCTGWKIGWTIGPEYLITAMMSVHASIIYTVPTPLQVALADVFGQEKQLIGTKDSYWTWLVNNLTEKRDRMFKIAEDAGLNPIRPDGGYFMLCDISKCGFDIPRSNNNAPLDQQIQEWLIKEKGIAVIPASAFYTDANRSDRYIRLCFIKGDETLNKAEEKFKLLKNV